MTRRPSAAGAPAPLLIRVPAIPTSLSAIRARLRRWLPSAALDPAAVADVLLAVGEAASNAVEHATRHTSDTVELEVSARATGSGVALTVKDNGRWRPPHPPGDRGLGHQLIYALVDAVTITPGPHGTTVEMRKELPA